MKKITKNLTPNDLIPNILEAMCTNQDKTKGLNDKINNHMIDTVVAFDTKKWETGIERNGEWTIVEQYKNEKLAKTGHKKWIKLITDNPKTKLKDINLYNL